MLAWPLIVFGAAVYAWCAFAFSVRGLGTPAPIDPPKVFVATGLYRWVRNPMYVGVLAVLAGENLLARSRDLAIYSAIVATFFHLFVMLYEEPALHRQFGASYDEYKRAVPRWLPRPPRAG